MSSYTGYTYLTIQPESVVLAPVYNLLRILAAIVALFLTISIFISYRLSRSVVKPVKHLKHIIQRMELDTLGQEKVTHIRFPVNELEGALPGLSADERQSEGFHGAAESG